MNYFTGIATGPVFDFPYSGYQTHSVPNFDNDINAILASITSPSGSQIYNQSPSITLQCVPQINTGAHDNTLVYQVPENMPIDMILQKLGIDSNTLQSSNTISNYYRTESQPMEVFLPPSSSSHRPRRLVCREESDTEDDGYLRRPPRQDHRQDPSNAWSDQPQQSPVALHNILSKVWQKAERESHNLEPSFSTPNINAQWESMRNRSSPSNMGTNHVWEAMRNASPPISSEHQNAVNSVWHRADYASGLQENRFSDMFNRMQQPPPPANREAVNNFLAARNVPYGGNTGPPSNAAINNFLAARNVPYGGNTGPPLNREAVNNFIAVRNLPYGINQPNPAVANVWNKADYATQNGPPMINIPWNHGPPSSSPSPMNDIWNRMQQAPPLSSNPRSLFPPVGGVQRNLPNVPAPKSFAALLSQAHNQHLPYAGAA